MCITNNEALRTNNAFIIHTDGGSRGNPGPAATGVVVYDSTYGLIRKFGRCIGINTNNVAEYTAVLDALNWLINNSVDLGLKTHDLTLMFKLDSQLVVEQLSGRWKVKDARLQTLKTHILSLISQHSWRVSFEHIPRSQNASADLEVNLALDLQVSSRA